MISLENLQDDEVVHQQALLIIGKYLGPESRFTYVLASTTDEDGHEGTFPTQKWPVWNGEFKCLVSLVPGKNLVQLNMMYGVGSLEVCVNYVPLLEQPLQFVVVVAKDSKELGNCPRLGPGIYTPEVAMSFVIAKMRMAAFMFQALMAEEMRYAGLGRRSFRLEDEWATETLSREFIDVDDPHDPLKYRSTIKIHVLYSEMTIEQTRKSDDHVLCDMFLRLVKENGISFHSKSRPFIAGLIIDSDFHPQDFRLGRIAFAKNHATSRSVGVVGSQNMYTWPSCIEDVTVSRIDIREGMYHTCWQANVNCQASLFEEIGHAFGIPKEKKFIRPGYENDWSRCFIQFPDRSDGNTKPCWGLEEKLRLYNERPFRLPSDEEMDQTTATVTVRVEGGVELLHVCSPSGIAAATVNGCAVNTGGISNPVKEFSFSVEELKRLFPESKPLRLKVLSMNGKHIEVPVWKVIASHAPIKIPGTDTCLVRRGVGHALTEDDSSWIIMLKKRATSRRIVRAYKIDIRVDERLQSPIIFYEDGTKVSCGSVYTPRGSQSRKLVIRRGASISHVTVSYNDPACLMGMRLYTSTEHCLGALNENSRKHSWDMWPEDEADYDEDEVVVGFYGTTGLDGMCCEFGLLFAPKNLHLPDSLYDLPQLKQNTVGVHFGKGRRAQNRPRRRQQEINVMDTSEDENRGYVYESCSTCKNSE